MNKTVEDAIKSALDSGKPKFCKDCKWARRDKGLAVLTLGLGSSQWEYARCARPEVQDADSMVAGIPSWYCSIVRKYDCGVKGKYWEPK